MRRKNALESIDFKLKERVLGSMPPEGIPCHMLVFRGKILGYQDEVAR